MKFVGLAPEVAGIGTEFGTCFGDHADEEHGFTGFLATSADYVREFFLRYSIIGFAVVAANARATASELINQAIGAWSKRHSFAELDHSLTKSSCAFIKMIRRSIIKLHRRLLEYGRLRFIPWHDVALAIHSSFCIRCLLLPLGGGEGGDGVGNAAILEFVQSGGGKFGEDVLGEEVALFEVRVATEDEGADAEVHVAVEFGKDLVGVADDGAGATAAGEADAAPEVGFEVEVGGLGAEGVLAFDADALGVLGAGFDFGAFGGVEFGDEAVGGGASFGFGFADDDVGAEAEVDEAIMGGGFFGHGADGFGDAVFGFWPHEEDVAVFGAEVLGCGGNAAEVHEWAAVLLVSFGGFGGGEGDLVEVALPFEGAVGAPEGLEDLDDFAGAGVAGFVGLFLAGEI